MLPVASMSSANPGGTVTITDGLGVSYTLDPVAGELVSSDNKVLYLDDSLTAILATGFRNILHGDSLSAIVAVECDESPDPDMCAEPMLVQPPTSVLSAPTGLGGGGLLFRVEPVSGLRPSGESLATSLSGSWPPSCLDIARELYHARDR